MSEAETSGIEPQTSNSSTNDVSRFPLLRLIQRFTHQRRFTLHVIRFTPLTLHEERAF